MQVMFDRASQIVVFVMLSLFLFPTFVGIVFLVGFCRRAWRSRRQAPLPTAMASFGCLSGSSLA